VSLSRKNFKNTVHESTLQKKTVQRRFSTLQPAAAQASALPNAADAPKQETAAATFAPVTSVVSAAPSAAANALSSTTASVVPLAAPQAPVDFKQLQQPRTYNGSTS